MAKKRIERRIIIIIRARMIRITSPPESAAEGVWGAWRCAIGGARPEDIVGVAAVSVVNVQVLSRGWRNTSRYIRFRRSLGSSDLRVRSPTPTRHQAPVV